MFQKTTKGFKILEKKLQIIFKLLGSHAFNNN